jgi:hypothetical protein
MKTPLLYRLSLLLFCLLASSSTLFAQNDLNLALSKPNNQGSIATASATTTENNTYVVSNVNDGNHATRWASQRQENQSLVIDLGSIQDIDRIRISWEAAYGVDFQLQVSDVSTFAPYSIVQTVTGNAPTARNTNTTPQYVNEYSNLHARGRYVRMVGTQRRSFGGTYYGYSIWEFEVFSFSNDANKNLAFKQLASASNSESNDLGPSNAFDGDPDTRWSTRGSEFQSLVIDLGVTTSVARAYVSWENFYAVDFELQTSASEADKNANRWTTFATYSNNQAYYNEVAVTASGRYFRVFAKKGFGGFSIYEFALFTGPAPLPVTLTSFTAVPQGKAVAVDWTTATELNNAGFEVQRSTNGLNFTTLAKITGAGNSQTANVYHYLDATPLATLAYYRLQQIDLDGKSVYSPVVAVQGTSRALATLSVYPNPTAERATLEWDASAASPVQWRLTNSLGQLVHTETLAAQAGHNTQAIDLQPYAAGSYVLTVEAAGQVLGRTRVQKNN